MAVKSRLLIAYVFCVCNRVAARRYWGNAECVCIRIQFRQLLNPALPDPCR